MEAAAGFLHQQGHQDRRSATPVTAGATFIVTKLDVGSAAVRPGIAEQLEQERNALLLASKAVLAKIRAGNIGIGMAHEYALEAAIRIAEAGKCANADDCCQNPDACR